jgi:hypothetical protein
MARVVIKRGADTAGIFSRIHVNIDGVRSASLLPLQSKETTIEAGMHEVVANMSWAKSRTVELLVEENDSVTLRVKCSWSAFGKALKSHGDIRGATISDAVLIEQVQ